ncbi:YSIRK-type signal peptide-containing protein, partial [Ligilactobacillus hayakitensis]|uniref:YSIRK-type signal peptide-containing protein n=1 Tax=Ligilactobacillus hayakitensis TaxID=396716 RepID=UPI000AB1920C
MKKQTTPIKQHFSIRKYSFGVTSVLIGMTFALGTGAIVQPNLVKADTAATTKTVTREVTNAQELVSAIKNANEGDTIKLGAGFKDSLTEANVGGKILTLNKDIIIDAGGQTLTLRGVNLVTAANVTLENINLNLLGEGTSAGTITNEGDLTLNNVTTLISQAQAEVRPSIVSTQGKVTIKSGTSETKFDKLEVKNGSNLEISDNNVRANAVIGDGVSNVKSASNFIAKYSGIKNLEFDGSNVANVEIDAQNLTLKNNSTVSLENNTKINGNVDVQENSTLNIGSNNLAVANIRGNGQYTVNYDGSLTTQLLSDPINLEVQKSDKNYNDYEGHVYFEAQKLNALPKITFQNNPNGLELNKVENSWKLEKSDEVDKSYLEDAINEANSTDVNNKTKASLDNFNQKLEAAKKILVDPNATQDQINDAEDELYGAIDALEDAPESEAPVSQTPAQSEAPVSQATAQSETPESQAAATSEAPVSQAEATSETPVSQAASQSEAPVSQATAQSETPVSQTPAQSETPESQAASQSETPVSQ